MANVQISQELFTRIHGFMVLLGYRVDAIEHALKVADCALSESVLGDNLEASYKAILDELNEKMQAQARRQAFSKYKSAPIGSDERNALREKYLDEAGISASFRSTKEVPWLAPEKWVCEECGDVITELPDNLHLSGDSMCYCSICGGKYFKQ